MGIENEGMVCYVMCDERWCTSRGPESWFQNTAAKRAKEEGFVWGSKSRHLWATGFGDEHWLCPACAEKYEIVTPEDWITQTIRELYEQTRPRRLSWR